MSNITARSTKPVLLAEITSLNEQLRSANLLAADLRLQLSVAKVSAPVAPAPAARTFVPRERNSSIPAHFVVAREAAMRLGRSVKVTA